LAIAWLDKVSGPCRPKEIANLQIKIKQQQEMQFNYAKSHNLPLTTDPNSNLEAKRLATLSNQLLEAENERKNLQAQYEAAVKENDPFSIPDVQSSARVDKLRERISGLKEKRDALLVIYTPSGPRLRSSTRKSNRSRQSWQRRPPKSLLP